MGCILLVFHYLCHELALAHHAVAYEGHSLHQSASAAQRREERYMEQEGVAGHHLLAEFHIVDLHEVGAVALRILHGAEHQQAAGLRHGLHEEHTGHHRLLGEVTLEERLVDGYVLHCHSMTFVDLYDFVDEQEELEVLLDSLNPTLILKVLSILKEKGKLTSEHKTSALNTINADEIKQYIDAL